jgi:phosphatidylglycerol:prolipoprotein diacylglycerol transferase
LVTLFYICFLAKKQGKDDTTAMFMLLLAAPGLLVGGALLFGLTNLSSILDVIAKRETYATTGGFWKAILANFGGSVFYGGLLGGMLTSGLYLIRKKDRADYADLGAVAVPLFHTFGRLGCFLTGCCYGVESDIGFVYHHAISAGANGVSRFPVQLVEMGLNIALFFLLHSWLRKGKQKGRLMQWYLLIYPVYRFVLEFFRGDDYRGFLFGLSTSQFISLLILLGNLIITLCRKKQTLTA